MPAGTSCLLSIGVFVGLIYFIRDKKDLKERVLIGISFLLGILLGATPVLLIGFVIYYLFL